MSSQGQASSSQGPRRRAKSVVRDSFNIYVREMLKAQYPNKSLTEPSVELLDSVVKHVVKDLVEKSKVSMHSDRMKTLLPRFVEVAVKNSFKDLAGAAESAGEQAIANLKSWESRNTRLKPEGRTSTGRVSAARRERKPATETVNGQTREVDAKRVSTHQKAGLTLSVSRVGSLARNYLVNERLSEQSQILLAAAAQVVVQQMLESANILASLPPVRQRITPEILRAAVKTNHSLASILPVAAYGVDLHVLSQRNANRSGKTPSARGRPRRVAVRAPSPRARTPTPRARTPSPRARTPSPLRQSGSPARSAGRQQVFGSANNRAPLLGEYSGGF